MRFIPISEKMGDPRERKNAAVSRLRNNLRKKRESLADQFDFKMYISIHFKDQVRDLKLKLPILKWC